MKKTSYERKDLNRRLAIAVIALILCIGALAACGSPKDEAVSASQESAPAATPARTPTPSPTTTLTPTPTPTLSSTPKPIQTPGSRPTTTPVQARADSAPILDQYYLSEKLMIEMLINDDVLIDEMDNGLYIGAESETVAILIMFTPGIQNLGAAGEIARSAVSQSFSDATIDELQDGSMFGARAKYSTFEAFSADGTPNAGITAATIVNQSFYNVLVVFEEGAPEYDMELMYAVFGTINILQPASVDTEAKTAQYESQYESQISSNQIQPSPKSTQTPVTEWYYLPYDYYSWWGDPGDYGAYPEWVYEPDWDYYSDYDSYWDWGWDDYSDWWFYDEYSDYYDYDYYSYYDDYWDDYDPWSDPGDWDWDYDYDDWSDPGDWDWDYDYDDWSDPGDWDYDYDYDYDDWSDPGDWDYDYDDWSDPGDYGYDDDWDW